jgi:hypothetical protein
MWRGIVVGPRFMRGALARGASDGYRGASMNATLPCRKVLRARDAGLAE